MSIYIGAPGKFEPISTKYRFQIFAWKDGNGNRLVVERKREPWHDENENPDYYIRLVPSGGKAVPVTNIGQEKGPAEAGEVARQYMRENSDQ
jgi:hypothetical protein